MSHPSNLEELTTLIFALQDRVQELEQRIADPTESQPPAVAETSGQGGRFSTITGRLPSWSSSPSRPNEIAQLKQENVDLTTEVDQFRSDLQAVQTQLSMTERELAREKATVQRTQTECSTLRRQCADLEADNHRLKVRIDEVGLSDRERTVAKWLNTHSDLLPIASTDPMFSTFAAKVIFLLSDQKMKLFHQNVGTRLMQHPDGINPAELQTVFQYLIELQQPFQSEWIVIQPNVGDRIDLNQQTAINRVANGRIVTVWTPTIQISVGGRPHTLNAYVTLSQQ